MKGVLVLVLVRVATGLWLIHSLTHAFALATFLYILATPSGYTRQHAHTLLLQSNKDYLMPHERAICSITPLKTLSQF